MIFKRKIMSHVPCLICGNYKVVKYGEKYYAYFKPSGAKCWGNSCEKTGRGDSTSYRTTGEAKAACARHLEAFGENPSEFNRL